MNPDDFKSALLARLGLTPAPAPAPSKSGQLLAAALGQPPSPVQPDATFVQNGPPRFPQMPTRSIGPVTKGNIPLPEATYQSQYRPRYDKAMSALADMLPVIGPARALYQAHQTAQQGHPLVAALGAAMAALPMGGRIGQAAEGEAARVASPDVRAWADGVKQALGLKTFEVAPTAAGDIKLSMLQVPAEQRGQGVGSEAMRQLTQFADAHGQRLILSPSDASEDLGTTSRTRLVKFYKRFGFTENTGKSRDLSISESMLREPQKP